jgi:ketosteroid isomerase-like protein
MDGILSSHTSDILLFDVVPPLEWRGIEMYQESWEQFFAWYGTDGSFDVKELSITAGDDVAFCHGIIHCSGGNSDGKKVSLEVRLTVGLRKAHDGWVISHEHHSEPSVI